MNSHKKQQMCDFLSNRSRKRGKRCTANHGLNGIKSDTERNLVVLDLVPLLRVLSPKNGRLPVPLFGGIPCPAPHWAGDFAFKPKDNPSSRQKNTAKIT
jgi:hypothetical protein